MAEKASFIVELKDDVQRRIVIDGKIWHHLGLKKGDYVVVTIEKLKVPEGTHLGSHDVPSK